MIETTIRGKKFLCDFVYSDEDKAIGLLKFTYMPKNYCMFFDYSEFDEEKVFTMKNMEFSIDMIGIDEFGIIQTIYTYCKPNDGVEYLFGQECWHVIECSCGTVEQLRLSIGQQI